MEEMRSSLNKKIIKSAIANYGLNFNMEKTEMLHCVSRVIYNHYINNKISMFKSKRLTSLIMNDTEFTDEMLTEIHFYKEGLQ